MSVPNARAAGDAWLLTGATVHTVSGETLRPGMVHVRDGRIAAVGRDLSNVDAPRRELNGLHVYPGLIAANSTLGLLEINAVRATRDTTEVGRYTPEVNSWVAVNPDSELIPVARANGIAYFEPVPFGGWVSGHSAVMATAGWTIEEMLMRTPAALHVDWPSMELNTTPKEEYSDKSRWKSLADQAKERRARLVELDDFFQEAEAYRRMAANGGEGADPKAVPAWESLREFWDGTVPLAVHANEKRQIEAALDWAEQRDYRIVIYGGRDAWEVAERLAVAGVPVVYEQVFALPDADAVNHDVHFRAPARLHEAGVKVIFGQGDSDASNLRNVPYAAAQAVAHGLPEEEALKGMTLYPAEILGVADRLGSIAPGKTATLVACDGNLLDLRSRVQHMWISGREVSLESRHTRLYEKYRGRPR